MAVRWGLRLSVSACRRCAYRVLKHIAYMLLIICRNRLYGVTCLQTFTYYRSAKAKNDGWLLWSLVPLIVSPFGETKLTCVFPAFVGRSTTVSIRARPSLPRIFTQDKISALLTVLTRRLLSMPCTTISS